MHELDLTSAVNKALAQGAHVQKAPQQRPSPSPDPNRGSMHFSDRPPLGYTVAGLHLEPLEPLLRDLKLATSSFPVWS